MRIIVATIAIMMFFAAPANAAPVIFAAAGFGNVQATVDAFRTSVGMLNPNVAGSFGSGRREINWDGVPDGFSAPNNLPANFFNANSPRGVEFSTPGTGLQVSANAMNPTSTPIEFGNLNATYPGIFGTFSPQRLFTALGSNIVDVNFFVPGSNALASVSAFGVVFTDVDVVNSTSVTYFDLSDTVIGTFFANALFGSQSLSFLGVLFNAGERIGHVRITSGNAALGPTEGGLLDLVVMDDFIYSEPIARALVVPEPTTLLLLIVPLVALLRRTLR